MKTAAVARLKAELSRYLRLVKSGEEIVVTERRVPVARLVPIEPGGLADEDLRDLERQGLLRLGSGKLPKDFWKQRRTRDPKGILLKALLKEREAGR
jgi:prevent-host-death family protein